MKHRPVWTTVALIFALVAAMLPLIPGTSSAFAAQPQRQVAKARTFFQCTWKGQVVQIKHVPNAPVENYKDAVVAGQCKKFKTNDKYYGKLIGKSINVFVAWREYPGNFVVHNGRQGTQPVVGAWTFAIGLEAPATLAGVVTDSTTGQPIAGATVSATHCVTKPVRDCTTYTAQTDSQGAYLLRLYIQGTYKVKATVDGYVISSATSVKIAFGNAVTTNVALVQNAVGTSLAVTANPNPVNVGQATTLTATVAQPVADGTVAFSGTGPNGAIFTAQMCTPVAGACTISWQPTTVGVWSISATWSGDSKYLQATTTSNVTVSPLASTLALASNPTQPTPNQTATVTATLGQAVSDGTVNFTATGPGGVTATIAPCTPGGGSCASSWKPTVAGSWSLSATWSGDAQYSPSTGILQVAVGQGTLTITVTPTPASPNVGQNVTATATLSQPVSDGSLTFTFTGPGGATSASQTCTPAVGTCAVTWTPPSPGAWTVTASWSGDSQYSQAAGVAAVSVGTSAIHLTISSAPNPLTAGQTGTLTAALDHAVSDGTVTFTVTGPSGGASHISSTTCVPNVGTCTVTWAPSPAGTWTVTAAYSGDSQYQAATSNTLSIVVTTTTLSLTASPTTITLNSSGSLTATLNQNVSDGTINFIATGPNGTTVSIPSCVPTNGSCSVQWTPSTSGNWAITAAWSGDGTYPGASSQAATVTVTGSANLTLVASPRVVSSGQNVTLTATLQNQVSDGTITFTSTDPNGSTVTLGACPPTFGVCQINFNPAINGTYSEVATWSGDATYPQGATSAVVTVLVSGTSASSIAVTTAPPSPVQINTPVTVTAQITPGVGDGTVTFTVTPPSGSPTSQNCTPTLGRCTYQLTPNAAGTWVVTAAWSGDAQYSPSIKTVQIVVTLPNSSTGVVANPTSLMPNQQGTLSATIAPAANDGTITFNVTGPAGANANLSPANGQCTPVGGTCSIHWQPDTAGTWNITATWSGDAQNQGSTSSSISVTVAGKALSLSVTPNPVVVSTPATLKATISSSTGTDTVTFTQTNPNGVTTTFGMCTLSASNTPTSCSPAAQWTPNAAGTWTISASITGGPDVVQPVSVQVPVTTGTSPSSIALSTNPSTPIINQPTTITAALAQAVSDGTVTFTATDPHGNQISLGTCSPANGTCNAPSWTPNLLGTWTLKAQWTGDASYTGSSTTKNVTVQGIPTTLALNPGGGSPKVNDLITVTATLSPMSGPPVSDGTVTVTIKDPNGVTFATPSCTPVSGSCTVSFMPTSKGTWTLNGTYTGGSTNASANATPVNVVVAGATISFSSVTSNPTSPVINTPATITATLSNPVSDGQITFATKDPNGVSSTLTPCTPSSGSCSTNWQPTVAGVWVITASYSGDSQWSGATATPINVTVKATSTVAVMSAPSSPVHNTLGSTLTATISTPASDGLVTFNVTGPGGGSANLGSTTCTPSAGSCSVSWNPSVAGQWMVSASWSGDSTNAGSTSPTVVVTVT